MTSGSVFSTWVLTAARATPTLGRTLGSLRDAGIENCQIFWDKSKVGCWQAWLGMARAFCDSGRSRWLLACEDDIEVSRGLAEYLRRVIPSLSPDGVYSLYSTAESRSSLLMEFSPVPPKLAQGSCCYLIESGALQKIVDSPAFPDRRDGTDFNLGTWCRDFCVPYLVHSPSLVLHTGAVTSLIEDRGRAELRQCHCFVREMVFDEVPELADSCVPLVERLLPQIGILPAGWRARIDSPWRRSACDPYSFTVFACGSER